MSRSLVVLPDDSAQPIIDAIHEATKSLRIKMFVFSDPTLLGAVIDAHRRGVKVRVMLNPARRSGEAENEESRKTLTQAGVEVIDSNPVFELTQVLALGPNAHAVGFEASSRLQLFDAWVSGS